MEGSAQQLVQNITDAMTKFHDVTLKLSQLAAWLNERRTSVRMMTSHPPASLYEAGGRTNDLNKLDDELRGDVRIVAFYKFVCRLSFIA